MSDFGDRITHIRKNKLKMTQKEFTDSINNRFGMNISRNMLSNWECSKQNPNTDALIAISEITGISIDYLLKGVANDFEIKTPVIINAEKIKSIDDIYSLGEYKSIFNIKGYNFYYKMQYDNMVNANIQKGDHILFHIQNTLKNTDIGAVFLNGTFMIKRYYIKDGQTILLNECADSEPIIINKSTRFKIIGKAVKIIKNL